MSPQSGQFMDIDCHLYIHLINSKSSYFRKHKGVFFWISESQTDSGSRDRLRPGVKCSKSRGGYGFQNFSRVFKMTTVWYHGVGINCGRSFLIHRLRFPLLQKWEYCLRWPLLFCLLVRAASQIAPAIPAWYIIIKKGEQGEYKKQQLIKAKKYPSCERQEGIFVF